MIPLLLIVFLILEKKNLIYGAILVYSILNESLVDIKRIYHEVIIKSAYQLEKKILLESAAQVPRT